jgi:HTH-type transcriptional regulator/antitoxin HigA
VIGVKVMERIPAEVFPPGEFIQEEIEARGWSLTDLAALMAYPTNLVCELISGEREITPETAEALGKAFHTGAQFWMNLERSYRLSLVEPVRWMAPVSR